MAVVRIALIILLGFIAIVSLGALGLSYVSPIVTKYPLKPGERWMPEEACFSSGAAKYRID